jgi:hypothetical protein
MRSSITLFMILFCCFGQEPPAIRVDVRLVNVTFSVRDAHGTLVTNLTKDDFEVLDDGVPQTISFFARSADLPLTLGLIVDMSGSQEHFMKQHRHDLQEFLKNVLTPRDRAFLICFGKHLRVASDFSASAAELIDGLKRFEHESGDMREIGPPDIRELGTAFYDSLYYSTADVTLVVLTTPLPSRRTWLPSARLREGWPAVSEKTSDKASGSKVICPRRPSVVISPSISSRGKGPRKQGCSKSMNGFSPCAELPCRLSAALRPQGSSENQPSWCIVFSVPRTSMKPGKPPAPPESGSR